MLAKSSAFLTSTDTKVFYPVKLIDTEIVISLLMIFNMHLSLLFLHIKCHSQRYCRAHKIVLTNSELKQYKSFNSVVTPYLVNRQIAISSK